MGVMGATTTLYNWGHDAVNDPGFFVGLVLLNVSAMCTVGSCVAKTTMSLDDAFEHGCRVGFRKGFRHGQRNGGSLRLVKDSSA